MDKRVFGRDADIQGNLLGIGIDMTFTFAWEPCTSARDRGMGASYGQICKVNRKEY